MKRVIIIFLAGIMMLSCLSACQSIGSILYRDDMPFSTTTLSSEQVSETHVHDFEPATCDTPKKCKICGSVEGEALGHQFREATCEQPATCVRCGEVQGEPLGHDYTVPATCTEPTKCSRCGATNGEALGHDYSVNNEDGSISCSRCGQVDPDSLPVNLCDFFVVDSDHYSYEQDIITDSYGYTYNGAHYFGERSWASGKAYAIFNLDRTATSFHGSIVAGTGTRSDVIFYFRVYLDDKLIYTSKGNTKTSEKEDFDLNVEGGKLLKIEFESNDRTGGAQYMYIVNAYLKK